MKTKKKNKLLMACVLSAFLLLGGIFLGISPTSKTAYADNPLSDFKFTQIGSGYSIAVQNKNITHADIPPTYLGLPIVEIAANGFASCPNLETVTFPASVKKIGTGAFMNCAKLKDVPMVAPEIIGQNAFALCKKIETLVLPRTVQTVGANALLNVGIDNATTTTIYSRPLENVANTWTGWLNSFSGTVVYGDDLNCTFDPDRGGYVVNGFQFIQNNTQDLYLDTHKGLPIVEIDENAFYWSAFKSVHVGFNSTHTINIKSYVFNEAAIPTIKLNNNVTFDDKNSTGDENNSYDFKSNSVFLSSTVQQVVLPDTLHSILPLMFQKCKELQSISYKSTPTQINILPSHVSAIYERAFDGCYKLPSLSFSDSVAKAGFAIFDEWSADNEQKVYLSLTKANISSFKQTWQSTNGKQGWHSDWASGCGVNVMEYVVYDVFFNSNGGSGTMSYQRFPVAKKEVLKTNTFTLSGRDFVGWSKNSNPTRVGIFDGYQVLDIAEPGDTINLYAIWSTVGLSYPLLSGGTYSVSIGTATSASYIFIPTYHNGIEVSEIAANGFSNRTNILDVTLPRKVKSIGDYAFSGCTGLTYFEIPSGVTYLGQGMLNGCTKLTNIVFPGNGTAPGDVTFKKMFSNSVPSALKTVTISGGSIIPYQAFYNCSYIETIILPDTIKRIENMAFWGCTRLKNIVLPEGLEYIGGGSFLECASLTSITIPSTVTEIRDEVFWGCTKLKTVILKRPASMGLPYIGWSAFMIDYGQAPIYVDLIAVSDLASETAYRNSCWNNWGWQELVDKIHYMPGLF